MKRRKVTEDKLRRAERTRALNHTPSIEEGNPPDFKSQWPEVFPTPDPIVRHIIDQMVAEEDAACSGFPVTAEDVASLRERRADRAARSICPTHNCDWRDCPDGCTAFDD
jgi:hypothetical protein